jgi:hypothetical protein
LQNFTCRYLSFLDLNVASPVYFDNETAALKAVEDGHAWGMVRLDHKFTNSLYDRIFESAMNSDLVSILGIPVLAKELSYLELSQGDQIWRNLAPLVIVYFGQ